MDAEGLRLGQIITTEQRRDAIHIAVVPMTAGETLKPGQRAGPSKEDGMAYRDMTRVAAVGVVDPYLSNSVRPGQRFWLFLDPGSITSLRHEWTHPAFPAGDGEPVGESEQWIRNYADSIPLDYDVLMSGADAWVATADHRWGGEYLTLGGLLEGHFVPDEFWPHYEKVRGRQVPEKHRQSFFSCSC